MAVSYGFISTQQIQALLGGSEPTQVISGHPDSSQLAKSTSDWLRPVLVAKGDDIYDFLTNLEG